MSISTQLNSSTKNLPLYFSYPFITSLLLIASCPWAKRYHMRFSISKGWRKWEADYNLEYRIVWPFPNFILSDGAFTEEGWSSEHRNIGWCLLSLRNEGSRRWLNYLKLLEGQMVARTVS